MKSPMRACVIHSQDVDSVDAVAELIAGAKVALGASLPRVAMLFAGIDHDFAIVLEQINAQWPGIALIGCTTDGEMSSHILFAEDSLALVLLSGDDFHALSGVARSVSTDVTGSIRASVNDAVQRSGRKRRSAAPLHHAARRPDGERVRCPQCVAGGVGRCGPDLRRHRRRPVAIQGHQAVPRHASAPGFRAVPPLWGGCCLFLWCGYRMAPDRARGAGH
jgi:FIST N domain